MRRIFSDWWQVELRPRRSRHLLLLPVLLLVVEEVGGSLLLIGVACEFLMVEQAARELELVRIRYLQQTLHIA